MYKKSLLSNGLRIVTKSIKGRDSIALGFWIAAGGRYENDPEKGIAHFLEHIVFKGSQKYSGEEIKMRVEGIGGTLNAFTAEEQTCFYAKIPAKHLNQTFDVLGDMVVYPKISLDDVKKEKTVIIEEIKMYHDLPQYKVIELLDSLMWPDHPLGKSLAGSIETVSGISKIDLRKFHERFYTPENIVIAACGQLNHERIVQLAAKKFKKLKKLPKIDYKHANDNQSKPRVNFLKKEIEQSHLAVGLPGFDRNHKDRYVLNLLSIILGGNMSSRLFVEVREKKGLAYSISCSYKSLNDTGLLLIYAGVDSKKLDEAIALILKELNKIKLNGVSSNEFQRAKDYLSGQLLLGLEDTMEHMLWVGEGIISKNKVKTLKSVLKELQKIKPSDIKRVAKSVLNKRRYNLAVVGPITDQQASKIKQLLSI